MRSGLAELARAFTWLGLTAFGGPAAHFAIMQREFVERRGSGCRASASSTSSDWRACCPGPSSTEVAMGIGYERGRWAGLIVAGLGFILPATLIVLAIAVVYEQGTAVTEARWLLYGMTPVVIAVILHALIGLVPTALTDGVTWIVGIGAFIASVVALVWSVALLQPLIVLDRERVPRGRGATSTVARRRVAGDRGRCRWAWSDSPARRPPPRASLGLLGILLTFLKMGVVVFGQRLRARRLPRQRARRARLRHLGPGPRRRSRSGS